VESIANFSRASLLSNGTTAKAYNLGAAAFLTTAQRFVIVGEEEPPLALDTPLPAEASVEGQRNTVSRTSAECSLSKTYLVTSATSIEEAISGDDEVADSLSHARGAAPERSKEVSGEGMHSQEKIRRRRRRSNTIDVIGRATGTEHNTKKSVDVATRYGQILHRIDSRSGPSTVR
jgi:hypothetical protein